MNYICGKCGKKYSISENIYKCTCGGIFNLEFEKKPIHFEETGKSNINSLWRYISALPFDEKDTWNSITLGEGNTPLIHVEGGLYAKADYYMPTLSFKDRGAVMTVSLAKKIGAAEIIIDSSGNAATATAAYAARAGIHANIFVPESTSEKKVVQIKAHGGEIHQIPGSREETSKAALNFVKETGFFYASHIFNPFFFEGTKTYVYEVFEAMGLKLPEAFIIPTGNGTLLLGAYTAFKELMEWGYIGSMPKIFAVQAKNCAPIYNAYKNGGESFDSKATGTLAEGIAIPNPPRGKQILDAVTRTNGEVIAVSEESIAQARKTLALKGIYVEITSAANFAAYFDIIEKHPEYKEKTIIMPLCGAGIKSN